MWKFLLEKRFPVMMVLVLVTAGCSRKLFVDEYLARDMAGENLESVDTIQLTDHSLSPPQTVEQATEELTDQAQQPSDPPEELELTLEEIRAAALENNLDLRVELFNPSIDSATLSEEQAKFEATFFGSAQRNRFDGPTSVGTQGTSSTIDSFNLGVRIPLRTGGEITIDLPSSRTESNNPFSLLDPAVDVNARFSISQPILRNAGVRANTHSIRVARLQKYTTESRTKLEAIRILANADRAYWRLYAAQRELEVRQQQYELAQAQLDRARRRVLAGEAAEIEVYRAESGLASRLEAIIIADNVVKRTQRDLKRIVNRPDLPMQSKTRIVTATDPQPLGLELDPIALADYALSNRMEMLEQELLLAIDASTIDFEKNLALPLFTLDYTYNINGLGGTFGDAFDQLDDKSFEDWSVGMNVEVPLGNEAAKARVHRAVLRRWQRLATKDQRALAIRQEVFDALDQLNQNWQRILAARQEVILSARTYEGEKNQFQNGLRTSTDVLDAAADLADAQSREILALRDYQITQVDIAFATGTLLGYGGIQWQPIDVDDEVN